MYIYIYMFILPVLHIYIYNYPCKEALRTDLALTEQLQACLCLTFQASLDPETTLKYHISYNKIQ